MKTYSLRLLSFIILGLSSNFVLPSSPYIRAGSTPIFPHQMDQNRPSATTLELDELKDFLNKQTLIETINEYVKISRTNNADQERIEVFIKVIKEKLPKIPAVAIRQCKDIFSSQPDLPNVNEFVKILDEKQAQSAASPRFHSVDQAQTSQSQEKKLADRLAQQREKGDAAEKEKLRLEAEAAQQKEEALRAREIETEKIALELEEAKEQAAATPAEPRQSALTENARIFSKLLTKKSSTGSAPNKPRSASSAPRRTSSLSGNLKPASENIKDAQSRVSGLASILAARKSVINATEDSTSTVPVDPQKPSANSSQALPGTLSNESETVVEPIKSTTSSDESTVSKPIETFLKSAPRAPQAVGYDSEEDRAEWETPITPPGNLNNQPPLVPEIEELKKPRTSRKLLKVAAGVGGVVSLYFVYKWYFKEKSKELAEKKSEESYFSQLKKSLKKRFNFLDRKNNEQIA